MTTLIEWVWNDPLQTWLWGNQNHGCGVFWDTCDLGEGWFANLSAYSQVISYGPFASPEIAKETATKELRQLEVIYG